MKTQMKPEPMAGDCQAKRSMPEVEGWPDESVNANTPDAVPSLASLEKSLPRCFCCLESGERLYRGAVLEPRDKPAPVEELAAHLDNRSVDELQESAEDALGQLLLRARCGDEKAIAKLTVTVRNAVGSLQDLASLSPEKMRTQAEMFPRWPVLLSSNPKDARRAETMVKLLAVGTKALTPTKPKQQVDVRSFWTLLAARALEACRINKMLVPALLLHCGGAEEERLEEMAWSIPIKATLYRLANQAHVHITDWQSQCVKLSEPITGDNRDEWWEVIKLCVLQHWHDSPDAYQSALKKIGFGEEKEYAKRNRAVYAVEQAYRSLVGVP